MSEREGEKVRKELLQTLARLSKRWPQLRLTQLIWNATPTICRRRKGKDLFYVEDSEMLKYLRKYEGWVDGLPGAIPARKPWWWRFFFGGPVDGM